MQEKTRYRIGVGMSVVLIMLAGFFDALSLIPLVGTIAGPIFWLIVGVYLWAKGFGIINGRKVATVAISIIIELIPILQELPGLMAGIIALLFIIRAEDKTGLSIVEPMKKGVTPPRLKRNPLNGQPGVRPPRKGNMV